MMSLLETENADFNSVCVGYGYGSSPSLLPKYNPNESLHLSWRAGNVIQARKSRPYCFCPLNDKVNAMLINARLLHALEYDSAAKFKNKPPNNVAMTANTKATAEIPINTLIVFCIIHPLSCAVFGQEFCRLRDVTYNIIQFILPSSLYRAADSPK